MAKIRSLPQEMLDESIGISWVHSNCAQAKSDWILMKKTIRALLIRSKTIIDLVIMFLAIPSAYVLIAFRRFGVHRLPLTRSLLRTLGVYPIRDHYYEPLFDPKHLSRDLQQDRDLPGIDLNEGGQLDFLRSLNFANELIAIDIEAEAKDTTSFSLQNTSFKSGDAEFLYQFIRRTKPKRLIEVGSGYSTKLARVALRKNEEENGAKCQHICIEPYEMPWLEELGIEIIREKVEDCPISLFEALEEGDLLFIDSSHMIRPQGDVLHEYLTVLPKLKNGVYVHIHDIFTPKDYLKEWIYEDIKFWNEQYLLEALLTNTSRYQVVAGLNFLTHHHFEKLKVVCPYLSEDREPGSFYLQIQC
jgi:methyltransferase family protein